MHAGSDIMCVAEEPYERHHPRMLHSRVETQRETHIDTTVTANYVDEQSLVFQ